MALPSSGAISLSQVNVELSLSATANISLNNANVRTLFGVASGAISLSNGWGKSAHTGKGFFVATFVLHTAKKVDFNTNVYTDVAAGVSSTHSGKGVSSSAKGYIGGGPAALLNEVAVNEIDGINFSSETSINPAATLAVARGPTAGLNSTTRGYWTGGWTYAPFGSQIVLTTEIDGIIFSSDTAINPAAALVLARLGAPGVSSSAKGYVGGGNNTAVDGKVYTYYFYSEIDGINFSTETVNNPSAVISQARPPKSSANSATIGYFIAGTAGPNGGTDHNQHYPTYGIDGINFSTETALSYVAYLPTEHSAMSTVNSETTAYIGTQVENAATATSTYYMVLFNFNTSTISVEADRNLPGGGINPLAEVQTPYL